MTNSKEYNSNWFDIDDYIEQNKKYELLNLIRKIMNRLEESGEINELLEWEVPKDTRREPFVRALNILVIHGVCKVEPPIQLKMSGSNNVPDYIINKNASIKFRLVDFNAKELFAFCENEGINYHDPHLDEIVPATISIVKTRLDDLLPKVRIGDNEYSFRPLREDSLRRQIMGKLHEQNNNYEFSLTNEELELLYKEKMESNTIAKETLKVCNLKEIFRGSIFVGKGVLSKFCKITDNRLIIKKTIRLNVDDIEMIARYNKNKN